MLLVAHRCVSELIKSPTVKYLSRMWASGVKCDEQMGKLVQTAQLNDPCAIVDINDNVIGEGGKLKCHLLDDQKNTDLHRAFSVMLFNEAGELLVQRRSKYKMLFPMYLSNTCCSHPRANNLNEMERFNGNGAKRAAIRRLNFELGVPTSELSLRDLHLVGRYHYSAVYNETFGENEIDYCFLVKKNVSLGPNEAEVDDAFYLSYEDLKNTKETLTPWFKLFIEHDIIKDWYFNLDNYCSSHFTPCKTVGRDDLPTIIRLS